MAVLPGKRVRDNSIFGTLTGSLTSGSTSMASTDLDALSTIAGDHAIITLDPFRQFGDPEIVMVTSHPVGATAATIQRGMYNTVARSHGIGVQWAHAATVEDFADVCTSSTRPADQFEGQVIYQTDTDSFLYWDGAAWRTLGAGAPSFMAYAEKTSNQGTITTEVDITDLSVTFTVPAGRRILVTVEGYMSSTVAADIGRMFLKEGGTYLQQADAGDIGVATEKLHLERVITPSAGTHTYNVRADRVTAGAGVATFVAGAGFPAFILVQDITGSESPQGPNSVPVGTLAQAIVTANQGSLGTDTDLTGLSVNISVTAGRTIRIYGQCFLKSTTANAIGVLRLKEGATVLQLCQHECASTASGETHQLELILSPSAGSHTYKLTGGVTAGTGSMDADPQFPSILYVEDITATPATTDSAPSSTLAYTEVTTDQGSFTAEVDLPNLTATIVVPAGRRIKITGRGTFSSTAADEATGYIKEGANYLGRFAKVVMPTIGNVYSDCQSVIVTPTAGSHTYKLAVIRSGTGTATFHAEPPGANIRGPAYILVEDITGVSFPILTLSPGGRHAVSAKRITSNQALVSNAFTAVVFNGVEYNENSAYNAATGVYTVPEDGLYTIKACIRVSAATPPFFCVFSLFKNGGAFRRGDLSSQSVDNGAQFMIGVENKFVVGDQLSLQAFIGAGETSPIIEFINDIGDFNWMTIRRVGPL